MAKKKSPESGNAEALGLAAATTAAIGLAIVIPFGPLLLPLGVAMLKKGDE